MSVALTAGQRQTLLEVEVLVTYLPVSKILNHQSRVTPGQVPVFTGGKYSVWSPAYIINASPICLLLLTHAIPFALPLALDSAGSSIAARIAMIAITTSNSISVKPFARFPTGRLRARSFTGSGHLQPFAPFLFA